jgi:hypothetical protein
VSITPETLAWLRQTAKFEGGVTAQVLLHLLERVEALEADATEQSQSSSFCNEAIVRRLEALEAAQRPPADHAPVATEMVSTLKAAPVATDDELCAIYTDPTIGLIVIAWTPPGIGGWLAIFHRCHWPRLMLNQTAYWSPSVGWDRDSWHPGSTPLIPLAALEAVEAWLQNPPVQEVGK